MSSISSLEWIWLKGRASKGLVRVSCQLLMSGDGKKVNQTKLNLVSYHMTIDFNMLSLFMENRICGYVQDSLIVTVENNYAQYEDPLVRTITIVLHKMLEQESNIQLPRMTWTQWIVSYSFKKLVRFLRRNICLWWIFECQNKLLNQSHWIQLKISCRKYKFGRERALCSSFLIIN